MVIARLLNYKNSIGIPTSTIDLVPVPSQYLDTLYVQQKSIQGDVDEPLKQHSDECTVLRSVLEWDGCTLFSLIGVRHVAVPWLQTFASNQKHMRVQLRTNDTICL
ncbi:hypothetical protein CEXT_482101 [Caerostris extrusa]|uniref:Uncharacterized protein n=1 Tax=Caerostris extrusa TaxID=172846 RepID=A0AAV4NRT9_CAEEX|nr:hypothetical protein CEXT_482101 [Caerostris extrusa]